MLSQNAFIVKSSSNGTQIKHFVAPDAVKVIAPSESILLPGNRSSTVININFITIIRKEEGNQETIGKDDYTDPKGNYFLPFSVFIKQCQINNIICV